MSIRQGLMVLLNEAPMYGAQLKAEFERRTGGTWPLNVGQVYTTLARLERDGLVEVSGQDADGKIAYRLTSAGDDEVRGWWITPIDRDTTPRNELAIKLALALTVPGLDVAHVVQVQRSATLRHLQDLTRLKATGSPGAAQSTELAWALVLENLVFAAEAEVRWLDHVEAAVVRAAAAYPTAQVAGPGTDPSLPADVVSHHEAARR